LFLKSLELQGFKSFPDKTVVTFDGGVNAIVGPNGSGKSNIVDAVRWVLGEQSTKSLRGGKMEDVIFGGTLRRQPLGFCEVTMNIDNSAGMLRSEYSELSVTRRYYRSGESDFFINMKPVRLRDIHELFMDTGLGRDGYSVIEQGSIDKILSVKSSERRELFDEASGISRFRYRKHEAEQKINACNENLSRVNDIIGEIEKQLGPLKEKSEKAKAFLILRDELRALEVTIWLDTLEKLKEQLKKADVDFANACRMAEARQSEVQEAEKLSEELSLSIMEAERELERVRSMLTESRQRESEIRESIAAAKSDLRNTETNIIQSATSREKLEEQLSQLRSRLGSRNDQLDEVAKGIDACNERIAAYDVRLSEMDADRSDISLRLEKIQKDITAKNDKINELKLRIAAAEASAQQKQERIKELETSYADMKAKAAAAAEEAELIDKELVKARETCAETANALRGYSLISESRKKKHEDLKLRLSELKRNHDAAFDRKRLLESMNREYQGFHSAVRSVMNAVKAGALKGIDGPLSMLIRAEPKFVTAVEVALGGDLQNIVASDEASAKRAIEFLKVKELGRATFRPLTAVKERKRPMQDLRGENGFLCWASDAVTCDERHRRLLSSLLSQTAVTDTLDSAIKISKKYSYSFRIVSLDGQLINPSGAMTGGSIVQKTGVLSRANEIDELDAKLKTLAEEVRTADAAQRDAARELEKVLYQAGIYEENRRKAETEAAAISARKAQQQSYLRSLEEMVENAADEIEKAKLALTDASGSTSGLVSMITVLEDEEFAMQAEHSNLLANLGEEDKAREEIALARNDADRELHSLMATREGINETISELGSMITATERSISDTKTDSEAARAELERLKALVLSGERSAAEQSQVSDNLDKLITEKATARMNFESRRTACEKELREKNNQLLLMQQERSRLEAKKTALEVEESQIVNRMWENYELTRTTAADVRIEIDSLTAANRRISELRFKIRSLGEVSISSIEEYEEISKRYTFLTTQRDDIEKSERELARIISELEKNMTEIFTTEFKKIADTFNVTFREVFGGGNASLRLEDDTQPLTSGVEINVELPGKSARAISLLSGGEKAFVAIALYFAIMQVRPTPFCVLDEIEAALDEANIDRFGAYLRKLAAGGIQFIVITHRRGTMESADMIYGVTMQEKGVTRLLSINVNEAETKLKIKPA